jgi:hypothetical protein
VSGQVEKRDAYIKMVNLKGNSDFIIVPDFRETLSDSVKISYPSLNSSRDEKALIITPQ